MSTTELIGLGPGICPAYRDRPQTMLYDPHSVRHAAHHDDQLGERGERSETGEQDHDPSEDPEPDREHKTEPPHGQPPLTSCRIGHTKTPESTGPRRVEQTATNSHATTACIQDSPPPTAAGVTLEKWRKSYLLSVV